VLFGRRLVLGGAVALVVGASGRAAVWAQEAPTCFSLQATIVGTEESELMRGTVGTTSSSAWAATTPSSGAGATTRCAAATATTACSAVRATTRSTADSATTGSSASRARTISTAATATT